MSILPNLSEFGTVVFRSNVGKPYQIYHDCRYTTSSKMLGESEYSQYILTTVTIIFMDGSKIKKEFWGGYELDFITGIDNEDVIDKMIKDNYTVEQDNDLYGY